MSSDSKNDKATRDINRNLSHKSKLTIQLNEANNELILSKKGITILLFNRLIKNTI